MTERSQAFMAADFPTHAELDTLRRELRAKSPKASYIHADILWRLRRGEQVTAELILELFPFLQETFTARVVHDLRMWGFITAASPVLQLEDAA
jgi:hypothetical protein